MSKNFNLIYNLMIYNLPLNVNGLRGYFMDSNHFAMRHRISCLKKFQVSSFKFKVVLLRAFPLVYYSLSYKLYERCVIVIVIRVLVCFDILILTLKLSYARSFVHSYPSSFGGE